MVAAKNKWEEQGFHFDDSLPNYGLEQFVYNRLHELGWFRLARQPARAKYNWVIEFYTNNAAGEDFSTVRGRRVPATAAAINAILGLPDDDPSFYAILRALEDEDFEQIKDFLCEAGAAWNTTGRNPHSVSRLSLRPDAKLWNTFVKRNIMPTSHNQTVDRTRLLLIHTILTGYRINVGEILAKELAAACANDKGILAFPCLISALYRRAAVPAYQDDKFQAEKKGWKKAVYMRKMDVADATPLNMAMPTSPASPTHMPVAPTDEAGPSNPATASSAPAEPRQPSADSPPVVPAASHTTTSPAATPANMPASRESTPNSPMGSTPEAPQPPPPAQSDEAIPLHILQLRNQLQRIETRQIQMHEETKVFQQSLINFLCYQFPAVATYFNAQPEATAAAHHSTKTQHIPSAHPSAQAGDTETLHLSSDDENDVFDWQSPRDQLQPAGPSQPTRAAPILSPAPTPANSAADCPTPDSPARRKSKIPAGRIITRSEPSNSEEEATHQPAQKRRRRHIITSDSDDDCSAAVPTSSVDPSLSFTF
ncbi:hypothetical protein V6N12_061047 [Hibiscus sabdariffa]|uniref:Putative plant transposon protein domain-containing protein n=1 Tax=Hibiscus sabdariffa TaxID=183260 RepID=A0ABR2DVX3_9ROSI